MTHIRRRVRLVGVLAVLLLASTPALAERGASGSELIGPYVKLGANIGAPDFDNSNVDGEVGGGVDLAVGYRALPWLAAEVAFDFLGGSDVEVNGNDIGDANYWAITVNAKAYPLSAVDRGSFPDWIQPYGLFGMGGGEIEVDFDGGGESDKGTFVARFGGGIDFLLARDWGAYIDGGYHVTSEDDLDGVGIFTLGAFYRF